MTPTREVYFNISHVWLMYLLFAVAMVFFLYGFYRGWRWWRIGQPVDRFGQPRKRLLGLWQQVALHERMLKRYRSAGAFHLTSFWAFVILTIGTTVVFIHEDLSIPIMQGDFYLYFQSFTLDVFGLLFAVALLVALYLRYGKRSERLKPDRFADGAILVLLLLILVTGFILEGARIQLTRDPWAAWSPVGNSTGLLLARYLDESALTYLHRFTWWFHAVIVFVFIGWIPYSKLRHLVTSPANVYLRNLGPKGALPIMDLEQSESLGVSRLEQFHWKDLLDLDACTECGRCEVNCPATLTTKPLSPKALILDLREALHDYGKRSKAPSGGDGDDSAPSGESPVVGPVIREETLWSCTTCRACMEQCPVMIEQVPKIVQMRRYLVMERAEFPDDLQAMVRSLEARGHPYPGATASRAGWMEGMEVPVLGETAAGDIEVLLWVGCAGALNERNKAVTRALARLLRSAGIRYAVLGRQERCTGDPARRIGHEFLFQTMAQQNISTFEQYGIKKVVTACPHCFNTLKNEYPQFGGNYEVVHHSEFLADLIKRGRLKPSGGSLDKVTFHDPCYLGRYNEVYDAPRQVLDSVPDSQRSEVKDWNRRNGLCCGGGGGFAFMEETRGTRMNQNRSRQLLETGAGTVAVACPFCMIMVEDGVKTVSQGRTVQVLDIAEILSASVEGSSSAEVRS